MAENNLSPPVAQALGALNTRQILVLMVAAATTVSLLAGLWMWGQTPDYRVLYGNLSDRDGGAVIESLQQMNVPYKFAEGGGALLVPANQVHEVRLRLASQGLPKGSVAGFELMENQKFGTSQFLEQVNYQRALEGELARSMQTLAAVQGARIHLAIPKPSVFAKEQQKPSASVVLSLYPGRMLDSGQINGIVHLISSSIPDMPAKNVTVVDQSGSLLSSARETGAEPLDASQLKYVQQVERDYIRRIEAIITPLVGTSNVRAQVTADIDFAQTEQTAEIFKPNQDPKDTSVRSQQKLEALNGGGQNAGGVPGALSNQPPVPATAPIVSPAEPPASLSGTPPASNLRRESTINYEVDRTIRYTKSPVGTIKRLSVAVVVNNRMVTDKNGKTSSKPLSEAEKTQVTALVKEAMGFDANRGDTLNVLNSPFNVEKEEPVAEVPLWKQPEYIALAKEIVKYVLIAGLLLFIVLKILRPAINSTVSFFQRMENEIVAARNKAAENAQQRPPAYQNDVTGARQLAQQDPKLVASVVKQWVGGGNE
ncbi:MAG: flagellar M-ring protein FliF [Nitrosomonadales bacterium]|nr:flagellar M-ring protein FliF [Nitrosomonadales bacterium]